jgi:hypothetical protein
MIRIQTKLGGFFSEFGSARRTNPRIDQRPNEFLSRRFQIVGGQFLPFGAIGTDIPIEGFYFPKQN